MLRGFLIGTQLLNLIKCFLSVLLLLPAALYAQTVELNGLVRDENGDTLPYATILFLPDSTLIAAGEDGNFKRKLPAGPKNIRITYTGYAPLQSSFVLQKDTSITFNLPARFGELKEVIITARRYSLESLIQTTRMGTTTLTKKDITAIPVLGGEADVIKSLQLLPGTIRGIEGSSDIFVRGGAADQNLVLLDGAPIYNSSHLFGFLSVFNPDILQKVESIHGGFPAEFGGRLSSILDISTNTEIASRTHVSGDIGLITSRLYIEQPLIKDKLSIWAAGRRSYIDQVFKLVGENLPYYFYDFNGKISFRPGKYDLIEIGYYGGRDKFELSQEETTDEYGFSSLYSSGNTSQTLNWHHRHKTGWKSKLSLFRTSFQYNMGNTFGKNELFAFSDIEDFGAKLMLEKDSVWRGGSTRAGIDWTKHLVSPNMVSSSGIFAEILESSATAAQTVHEAAAYIQQEWPLSDRLLARTGFRGSFALLSNKNYFVPEPRVSLRYSLREDQSLKVSYSRMAQYMHRISSSAISSPTDIWHPVTERMPPQNAQQLSAAWQKFFKPQELFLSVEAYYKRMENLPGYEEGTNLFFNPDFESKVIQGKGRAYGLEFLLRKEAGRLRGWLSYTLSWSARQYDELNKGKWFPARYDRRHNGAIVTQYKIHERWEASMVWEFISGSRFTPIIGQYVMVAPSFTGVDLIPVYSGLNQVKLADTHRLDLGIKYKNKPGRKFGWHLFAGVNNVYNRASPVGIFVEQNESNGALSYTQPGLFGLLPFVSFGFKF